MNPHLLLISPAIPSRYQGSLESIFFFFDGRLCVFNEGLKAGLDDSHYAPLRFTKMGPKTKEKGLREVTDLSSYICIYIYYYIIYIYIILFFFLILANWIFRNRALCQQEKGRRTKTGVLLGA